MSLPRFTFAFVFAFLGCGPTPVERVEWTTMGTVAALQTRGPCAVDFARANRGVVQRRFAAVEKLLNAHDPDSELCRLAPLSEGGILSGCTDDVRACYAAAFRLMRESGGAFNPRWRGPRTLDLGAIAKGFAVDFADDLYVGDGVRDAGLLDLGGNLKSVRGTWKVGIAGSDVVITLTNRMACATSAEYFRGKHIYDGRTGRAVSNDVVSVTVVATDAMRADVFSTTAFIFGPEESRAYLDGWHTWSAVWILKDGRKVFWENK